MSDDAINALERLAADELVMAGRLRRHGLATLAVELERLAAQNAAHASHARLRIGQRDEALWSNVRRRALAKLTQNA